MIFASLIEAEIRKLHAEGLTYAEAAKRAGCTGVAMRARARIMGLRFARPQFVADRLRALLTDEPGLTMREAAARLGVSYQVIVNAKRKSGLAMVRGYHAKQPTLRVEFEARHAELLSLYDVRQESASIARQFGISQERVRQIAEKAGRVSRSEQRRLAIAELARRHSEGEALADLAKEAGYSGELMLIGALKAHGHAYQTGAAKHRAARDAALASLAERVRAGESIRSVCDANRTKELLLSRLCRRLGIVSRHSRWHRAKNERSNFNERHAVRAP